MATEDSAPADSSSELSELELAEVTGGDTKSKTSTKSSSKGNTNPYSLGPVVISICSVLIS